MNTGKLTKFLVYIGFLRLKSSQIITNQIVKSMKVAKFAWRLVKFGYYLIKGVGYQVFIDAWKKSGE